ncbi:hypothetical protein AX17_004084 [Amanita inopinata Kibby_2008]|nr:hypothetical protein AX17_004084 [Amanita inopinata Kibby_2008]
MVKGNPKSSATSATRKKHAKRAAPQEDPAPLPKEKKPRGKDKGKKKEPRQKMYIPPVKPAPVQPDPLETTGLSRTLPPELLVVLRSFGKKAEVTKIRALEELQSSWVDKCTSTNDDMLRQTLVEMLPVWFHRLPSLFLHPSRRIRALTAVLHASLLQIPAVRDQMLFFLLESASQSQVQNILGTWCMAAHDVDKTVSTATSRTWKEVVIVEGGAQSQSQLLLNNEILTSLVSFTQRSALDPLGIHAYLNPAAPVAPPPSVPKKPGGRTVPAAVRKDSDHGVRSRTDDVEENEQDRKARIRCGAMGAIKWVLDTSPNLSESMTPFFLNPAFWSALCPMESCPFADTESFGYAEPAVRKSAWSLLQCILRLPKERVLPLIPVLSSAVLRSAWVETDTNVHAIMWQPLLTFLKGYPSCWESKYGGNSKVGVSDKEDETDEEAEAEAEVYPTASHERSTAYREFLQFLELGCGGSPVQGYPAVLVILSTIPNSLLLGSLASPFADFFASMWAAIEGHAFSSLQRSAASSAFLSSLVECTLFLVKRLCSRQDVTSQPTVSSNGTEAAAQKTVSEQTINIWESICSKKLKVADSVSSKLLSTALISLYNIQEALFTTAWKVLSQSAADSKHRNPQLVATFLYTLQEPFSIKPLLKDLLTSLTRDVIKQSVEENRGQVAGGIDEQSTKGLHFLIDILNTFRGELFKDQVITKILDEFVDEQASLLLEYSTSLTQAYLMYRDSQEQCLLLWHTLLSIIAERSQKDFSFMSPILDAAESGRLPPYLRPRVGELDELVQRWIGDELTGSSRTDGMRLIQKMIRVSSYILTDQGLASIHQKIFTSLNHHVQLALRKDEAPPSFDALLYLLDAMLERASIDSFTRELDIALLNVFVLAYLLPEGTSDRGIPAYQHAQKLWTQWFLRAPEERRDNIISMLKKRLRTMLCTTETRLLPDHIIKVASDHASQLHLDLAADLLPSRDEYDELLAELSSEVIHPSLAVVDPLISPEWENEVENPKCDARGFSRYARAVCGLIQVLSQNRHAAKRNIWALKHILAFVVYASDFQSFPAGRSPLFSSEALNAFLDDLVTKAMQITTYLLTSSPEDNWRQRCLDVVLNDGPLTGLNTLSSFLVDMIIVSKTSDSTLDTRSLKLILQHVLDEAEKDEADRWLLLAKKIEYHAPQTSMMISSAMVECALESQRLDRYRNELAASMLGIPTSRANTEGLLTLRKLAAVAPDPDSDVVFLPQHRALNVVKACQQWISSDEEIDEEAESAMTLVFAHLAPILQNVSGSHWEFIFDVVESNLEASDIGNNLTLVALSRALRLIIVIQNLVSTNKSLLEDWKARRTSILTMVRDMAMAKLDAATISVPRSICRELILTIIQDMPPSLIDHDTLPKMCHLLMEPSSDVQKMAYRLLHAAAKKRTEYLVIEAGVDVEYALKAELPSELIDIVHLDLMGESEVLLQEGHIFGYLLGWMLIFDSFQDASLKVRSSYIDQLRNLDLIYKRFMPGILGLLHLENGVAKAFKLDIWSVDQYYVELYETGTVFSLPLLAAHLYYRALLTVPALIHSWMLDCKDRQMSSAVISYTSAHFSPLIIHAELAHAKSAEATSELVDEAFTIKVMTSTNEVTAAYAVDEHQLEIKLRIPPDWPLHKIEVKDVTRVGVDEHRWRAWILAVQQSIWSHNGRILDGIALFKKNVTLHFEGQTECAICYSIISPMDGSLPKKPCKTCRNRFHAGCLYKWFNTSHSSSCPLCRSDII